MGVDPASTPHIATHGGVHHYFCSAGCRAKFEDDPARYMSDAPRRTETAPEGAIWTCPMHPAVQQPGPGSCPICGMALEPMTPTLNDGPSSEYADMKRRFVIGLILALPVVALEMGGHLTGLRHLLDGKIANLIQMALATPVVLWAGWPFFAYYLSVAAIGFAAFLFAQPAEPWSWVRNWGMRGFDRSGPLKHWVVRQAMGGAQNLLKTGKP